MTWQIVVFMGVATLIFVAVVFSSIKNNKQLKKEKQVKDAFS